MATAVGEFVVVVVVIVVDASSNATSGSSLSSTGAQLALLGTKRLFCGRPEHRGREAGARGEGDRRRVEEEEIEIGLRARAAEAPGRALAVTRIACSTRAAALE